MNTEEQQRKINEYFDLWEKYRADGEKEKARECLKKVSKLKSELWEYEKNELKKLCEKVGVSFEDLQREINT